jgi:pilus assembly protein CpaF
MDGLIKRSIILKYRYEIDDLVRTIRRWITECDKSPEPEEIRKRCEDEFFHSADLAAAEITEMKLIISAVYDRVSGRYGILQDLLADPSVNEIMVNGPDMIFAERNRELVRIDDAFTSEDELEENIRMLASDVHREINEANPIVDARLP